MDRVDVTAVAEFAAASATVLAAWQVAPQVWKLRRDGSHAGLSPTWALLGVVTNVAWVAYRWVEGLWFGLPSPAVAAVLYSVLFLFIGRAVRDLRWTLVAAMSAAAVLAIGAFRGWAVLGVMLGLSGGIQAAPSVWAAFRTRVPVGIAPSVWAIGVAQATMWGFYGNSVGDNALVLYGLTMGTASLAVLARYFSTAAPGFLRGGRAGDVPRLMAQAANRRQ
ncbi:MAG: hypothetical protein HKN07_01550 [Acidimicrobiia bacterium]|nr:hypothetical protein [Acidimicrobiia bacterium]